MTVVFPEIESRGETVRRHPAKDGMTSLLFFLPGLPAFNLALLDRGGKKTIFHQAIIFGIFRIAVFVQRLIRMLKMPLIH